MVAAVEAQFPPKLHDEDDTSRAKLHQKRSEPARELRSRKVDNRACPGMRSASEALALQEYDYERVRNLVDGVRRSMVEGRHNPYARYARKSEQMR